MKQRWSLRGGASRPILVAVSAACVLGTALIVVRGLADRRPSPRSSPGAGGAAEAREVRAPEIGMPASSDREPSEIERPAVVDPPQPSTSKPAEPLPEETQRAIEALLKAHEFAASFSGEGPTEMAKSTAELALLQTCVGHVLAKANRGIEAGADAGLSRMEIAEDEVKFFHDGRMFVVRRGEFPAYDEARDRISTNFSLPRSPGYYREYNELYSKALSSLGARDEAR